MYFLNVTVTISLLLISICFFLISGKCPLKAQLKCSLLQKLSSSFPSESAAVERQEMLSSAIIAQAILPGKRGFYFSWGFVLEVLCLVRLESGQRRWTCSSLDLSPVSQKAAWGKGTVFCKCFLLSVYPAGGRRWHRLLAEQRSLLCNEQERNGGWGWAKNNWIHCYSEPEHRTWRKPFCFKFIL